ncbi:hypothetical protein MMPV_005014 [Pyropia vietnamensis]
MGVGVGAPPPPADSGDDEELAAQRLAARRLLVRRVDVRAGASASSGPPLHAAAAVLLGADGRSAGGERAYAGGGLAPSAAAASPPVRPSSPLLLGRRREQTARGGGRGGFDGLSAGASSGTGAPYMSLRSVVTPDGGLSDGEYVVADESFRFRARPLLRQLRADRARAADAPAADGWGWDVGGGGRFLFDADSDDAMGSMGGRGGGGDADEDGGDYGPLAAAYLRRRLLPPGGGGLSHWQAEAVGLSGLPAYNMGGMAAGEVSDGRFGGSSGRAARRAAAHVAEIHELVALHRQALGAAADAASGLSLSYEQLLELEAHNVRRGLSASELRRLPVRHIPVDRSNKAGVGTGGGGAGGSGCATALKAPVNGPCTCSPSPLVLAMRSPRPSSPPRPPTPPTATTVGVAEDPDAITPTPPTVIPTRRLSDRSVDAPDGTLHPSHSTRAGRSTPPADRWPGRERPDRSAGSRHSADGWAGRGGVGGRWGADGPPSAGTGRSGDRRTGRPGDRLGEGADARLHWPAGSSGRSTGERHATAAVTAVEGCTDGPSGGDTPPATASAGNTRAAAVTTAAAIGGGGGSAGNGVESPPFGSRDVASSICLVCLEPVAHDDDTVEDGDSTVDWDVGGSLVGEGRSEASGGAAADGTVAVVVLPPCGHAFHEACIKRWLHGSRRCPVCRAEL